MATKIRHILFYSDALASFNYGANHPFKPERAKLFYELLNRYALIFEPTQSIIAPRKLDEKLLLLFHSPQYIESLKRCDRGEFAPDMLSCGIGSSDNPVLPGILAFSLEAAGATHDGAMILAEGKADVVFNPHGGFHHAKRDSAEGFCYINDIAIAVTALINQG
ncbi:MAG: hypothetical protein JXI32_04245, partial [Deltaproteobacteria bacterium]|nr:hypothetical protein [Deltaproteobacteria bacterium]